MRTRRPGTRRSKLILFVLLAAATVAAQSQSAPPPDAFSVLPAPSVGPQITPYLQYQTELAWQQDEERLKVWNGIKTEADLLRLQNELRQKLLAMLGGLPAERAPLHPQITGRIALDGFHIEKLIFESLPGVYVTALLYLPEDSNKDQGGMQKNRHPAVLVPAGHAENGKAHYQSLCQRLVRRGYVVISWDPVGQGERSQFWDTKSGKSRYNRICAEHAIMGNLAYLASISPVPAEAAFRQSTSQRLNRESRSLRPRAISLPCPCGCTTGYSRTRIAIPSKTCTA